MKLILFFLNILFITTLFIGTMSISNPVLADKATISQTEAQQVEEAGTDLKSLIKAFYLYLSRIIVILSVLMGIIGGYMYMTSGGSPESIKKAKEIILSALIGIVAVAFAYLFFEVFNIGILG